MDYELPKKDVIKNKSADNGLPPGAQAVLTGKPRVQDGIVPIGDYHPDSGVNQLYIDMGAEGGSESGVLTTMGARKSNL